MTRTYFRTWAEFKAAVEAQGVRDEDEIQYIDVSAAVTARREARLDDPDCPVWILE